MENKIIGIRLSSRQKELLEKVAKTRGEDMSSFARRAIFKELAALNYLTIEEKKALGV